MTDKEKILQMAKSPNIDSKLLAYAMGVVRGLVRWEEYFGVAFERGLMTNKPVRFPFGYDFNDLFHITAYTRGSYDGSRILCINLWVGDERYFLVDNRKHNSSLPDVQMKEEAEQAIRQQKPLIQAHFCNYFKLPRFQPGGIVQPITEGEYTFPKKPTK